MARIEGPKYLGSLTVDLTPIADDIQDIAPGGLQGARAEKEGLEEVLLELAQVMPMHGEAAEIHPAIYPRVVHATESIKLLTESVLKQTKLLEVSRESLARLVNNREEDLSSLAKQAEDKGEKGKRPELLAHYEKTIHYRSQTALKAVETRQKNEAAKAEAEADQGTGGATGAGKAGKGEPTG